MIMNACVMWYAQTPYVTGFAKDGFVRTQFKVTLLSMIQQIHNRLTVHAYTIAKGSTICFN